VEVVIGLHYNEIVVEYFLKILSYSDKIKSFNLERLEIESYLDYNYNRPGTFLVTPAPSNIKGGQKHLPNSNHNHNINCPEQYKNTRRRVIILQESETYLKILASLVLPSFSRSHHSPPHKFCVTNTNNAISVFDLTPYVE
jgi:hypothetical protein